MLKLKKNRKIQSLIWDNRNERLVIGAESDPLNAAKVRMLILNPFSQ